MRINPPPICRLMVFTPYRVWANISVLHREQGSRADLLMQTKSLLCELLDWLEANPDAADAVVEMQMKKTWRGLREAMVKQVVQMRR